MGILSENQQFFPFADSHFFLCRQKQIEHRKAHEYRKSENILRNQPVRTPEPNKNTRVPSTGESEQIAHDGYIWFDRTLYKLINHGANKISKIFCGSCTTFHRIHYYKNYCTRTPGIPIVFVFHFYFYFFLFLLRSADGIRCALPAVSFFFILHFIVNPVEIVVLTARKA